MSDAIEDARALLESSGFVVLREKSYRQAQERQRVAEALRAAEVERREDVERWAREVCTEERYLRDRLTFVYGVACAHGATAGELGRDPQTEHQVREDVANRLVEWCRDGRFAPWGDVEGAVLGVAAQIKRGEALT